MPSIFSFCLLHIEMMIRVVIIAIWFWTHHEILWSTASTAVSCNVANYQFNNKIYFSKIIFAVFKTNISAALAKIESSIFILNETTQALLNSHKNVRLATAKTLLSVRHFRNSRSIQFYDSFRRAWAIV